MVFFTLILFFGRLNPEFGFLILQSNRLFVSGPSFYPISALMLPNEIDKINLGWEELIVQED